MKIIRDITLDLSRHGVQCTIPVTQHDVGTLRLVIHLRNGSVPVILEEGDRADLFLDADVFDPVTVYTENGTYPNCLVYDVSARATATIGTRTSCLQIYKNSTHLQYSPEFAFAVRKDMTNGSSVLSSPQYASVLLAEERASQYAMAASESADHSKQSEENAEQSAQDSAAFAQRSKDLVGFWEENPAVRSQKEKGITMVTLVYPNERTYSFEIEDGKPFTVARTYESETEMNEGYATDDVAVGEFVMISTKDVNDEENARLYVKGKDSYVYMSDLSGYQGLSVFVRFSANADGTDFTETWIEGQEYVGFATGLEAPTEKDCYKWACMNPRVVQTAISEDTAAFGTNTIAGCKGYYWTAFDPTSNKITLSGSQTEQTDIGTLNWQVGDTISIDNHNKWDACGKITEVGANYIKVDTLPFTERVADPDELTWDDYAVFNIDRPTEGIIDLGRAAFAIGTDTKAIGWQSYAEGVETKAIGRASHAEGRQTTAVYCAHAEGRQTEALGHESHAEGKNTKTLAMAAHAEGYKTISSGEAAHAEGGNTQASDVYSHAEGYKTEATADASHAEGMETKAYGNYSHAEGNKSIANAKWSHAEGGETQANGDISHAEGYRTQAKGSASHAEGMETKAIGSYSHAGGTRSEINGQSAFGHGTHVKTTNRGEAAFGNYNNTSENTLFSIGNGESDNNRSNAFWVEKDGGAFVAADRLALVSEIPTKLSQLENDSGFTSVGQHAEGGKTTASGIYAHAEGYKTEATADAAHAEGMETKAGGNYSHAEGRSTTANAKWSHAEGGITQAIGDVSHAEGYKTIAEGSASHAEGMETKAIGSYSHAEGRTTQANAKWSHAEGGETQAIGDVSHAEGYKTEAEGGASHAEGQETKAIGQFAHAGGFKSEVSGNSAFGHGTHVKTTNQGEAAFGNYNKTGENTSFSIGCGKSDSERENSFEVREYDDGHKSILVGDVEITDEQITKLLALLL